MATRRGEELGDVRGAFASFPAAAQDDAPDEVLSLLAMLQSALGGFDDPAGH
ncbi:hypothetical protein KXD98_20070 [Mycobacterium sp. SMC-4]|nr:hypothetical protein KXD98_20070 [Mycobacterium sp. SMC-4]